MRRERRPRALSRGGGQQVRRARADVPGGEDAGHGGAQAVVGLDAARGVVGIAVVDQVSIAGGLLAGLEVRPFQSSEKLAVRIVRNRYRPMSVAERAFVEIFDSVWVSMIRRGSATNGG